MRLLPEKFLSRPARIGDKLTVHNFNSGTRGFAAAADSHTVVCLLPGTELAFDDPIRTRSDFNWLGIRIRTGKHRTAIFRQVDKNKPYTHHDALEFPDGKVIKLTMLDDGQTATVLQLPAAPKTPKEVKEQQRLEVVG